MPKNWPQSFRDTSKAPSRIHITLYRVTLPDGTIYRFADRDTDVTANILGIPYLFVAFGHRRGRATSRVNLTIDSMDISMPNVPLMLQDGTRTRLGDMALLGFLDGGIVELFKWDGDNPLANAVPHTTWIIQKASTTRTTVSLRLESPLARIDRDIPKTIQDELCQNELFDEWCGVPRPSYEITTSLFPGPAIAFEDLFNRFVLGTDWTDAGVGSVTLDGSAVMVQATVNNTMAQIYRTPPTFPFTLEIRPSNWAQWGGSTLRSAFLGIQDTVSANNPGVFLSAIVVSGGIRIDITFWNGTSWEAIGGRTIKTTDSPLFRLYCNGRTVWFSYSIDAGKTWIMAISTATQGVMPAGLGSYTRVMLVDERPSGQEIVGHSFDSYREYTGDVSPIDIRYADVLEKMTIRTRGTQPTDYYSRGELTYNTGAMLGTKRMIRKHTHADWEVARYARYTYLNPPQGTTDPHFQVLTDLQEFNGRNGIPFAGFRSLSLDGVIQITIDLGASRSYKELTSSFTGSAIPSQVEYLKSDDGVTFTSLGAVSSAAASNLDHISVPDRWRRFTLTLGAADSSRYVRVIVTRAADGDSVEMSEVFVRHPNGIETLSLAADLPRVPSAGDSIRIVPGCDKRMSGDCKNKFNNLMGFRGCPRIPKPTDTL
jgi:hypothetical protein